MKAITESLGVSRSQQYERRKDGPRKRNRYQPKREDEACLSLIGEVIGERPTYGYRRVTIMMNRRRSVRVEAPINHKRMYRIMRANHLLLRKHTGRPLYCHEGTIMTPRSDQRWCSDGFEIACDNGQRVRIAFSMDCCDREIMSYVATTGGITSAMIQDLMIDAVENRFGSIGNVKGPIEWLSDNGSAYTAADTQVTAQALGLVVCTTQYRSPESNGMAEAFVKTFKRDYVGVHDLQDAITLMEYLPKWFADYNECHPHKALKMKSPREFRRHITKLEACPV